MKLFILVVAVFHSAFSYSSVDISLEPYVEKSLTSWMDITDKNGVKSGGRGEAFETGVKTLYHYNQFMAGGIFSNTEVLVSSSQPAYNAFIQVFELALGMQFLEKYHVLFSMPLWGKVGVDDQTNHNVEHSSYKILLGMKLQDKVDLSLAYRFLESTNRTAKSCGCADLSQSISLGVGYPIDFKF